MLSRGKNLYSQDLGRIGQSKIAPYLLMLLFSKLLYVSGTFVSFDLLQSATLLQVISTQLICSSVPFILLQRPFASLRPLPKSLWLKIFLNACGYGVVTIMWGMGLQQVGPIRAILLFDYHELVILACISYLISGSDKNKFRGALLFILGVIVLLVLDNDAGLNQHAETVGESHVQHAVYMVFDQLGVPDHKHGVIMLVAALICSALQRSYQKKLAVETGGNKKLHALTIFISGVLLFIPSMVQTLMEGHSVSFFLSSVLPWSILVAIAIVCNYYVENICISKLDTNKVAKYSTIISFLVTIVIGYFWHGQLINIDDLKPAAHHHISGGVVVAAAMLALATIRLAQPSGLHHGTFIGYAETGLPMYSFDTKVEASKILPFIKSTLKQILENYDSRQIFYFLLINLVFCVVELVYGIWTNSLGLISDGFHMMFDCAALLVGLLAALMQKWNKTRVYSYGYARVDILSGYVNGLLLIVVAFFVFTEALERIFDPPEVKTDRLFIVSVLGLIVNLIGIFAFSHAHSHGGVQCSGHGAEDKKKDEGCSHSHDNGHGHSHDKPGHGHSHDKPGHGHSHDKPGHDEGHGHSHDNVGHGHSHNKPAHEAPDKKKAAANRNLQGVFLHIMADTLGSVGVIISSLFIEYLGWLRADPICSIFIAVLIFLSVLPLIKDSMLVLLQRVPEQHEEDFYNALDKISKIEHVVNILDPHLWMYSSSVSIATVRLYVTVRANEQKIISQAVSILKEAGFSESSVQVDKELFRKALQSYGPSLLDSTQRYNVGLYNKSGNAYSMT